MAKRLRFPSFYQTHTIIDTQHNGMPIEDFKYPEGWEAESMALWNWTNTNNLILISGRVWNADDGPQAREVIRIFPDEQYYWLGYSSRMFDRPGSISLSPEVPAASVLLHYVIPRYRSSCKNLRIQRVLPVPNLANSLNLQKMVELGAEGVCAQIKFMDRGVEIEELFFALKYVQPHAGGQQNWGLAAIFSARARPEDLADVKEMAISIIRSIRPNPQWQAMFSQIANQLNAQQINALTMQQRALQSMQEREQAALSNYLDWSRKTQGALLDAKWAGESSNPMKQFSNWVSQFGDEIMGRTSYVDPLSEYGNPHHDYSYAQYVYTDGQGGWLYTDDPNFDPNVDSDRTWKPATRQ